MVILALLVIGFALGFVLRLKIKNRALACLILSAVPISVLGYVGWMHAHTRLSSTSVLDWLFVPLWPTTGAIAGFLLACLMEAVRG